MARVVFVVALLLVFFVSIVDAASSVSFNVTEAVVYPQSTGLVVGEAWLPGGGSFSAVLPPQAVRDSIRISEDGGSVKMVRASDYQVEAKPAGSVGQGGQISALLVKSIGRSVRFETGRGEYSGRLVWFDESSGVMVLQNVTYSILLADSKEPRQAPYLTLSASQVVSLVLDELPALPENPVSPVAAVAYPRQDAAKTLVSWVSGSSAPRMATLSYLTGGLSWKPQFYLDLSSSSSNMTKFSYWAQVGNGMGVNLTDVRLRLVAGNINLQQVGYHGDAEWMSQTQSAVGNIYNERASPGVPSTLSVEEYEVYDFPSAATLFSGETVSLPVFDDYVSYEKDYVWDARSSINYYGYSSYDSDDKVGKVQKIYRVKNEGRTWPYGVVSVFQDGMLTGQDTISWTPKGGEAKVTVGYAPDIEVKKRETVKAFARNGYGSNQDYRHTATLKLKNYKSDAVSVLVMDQYPQNAQNFTASVEYDEKPGNLMYWTVDMGPGEDKELTYTYITD